MATLPVNASAQENFLPEQPAPNVLTLAVVRYLNTADSDTEDKFHAFQSIIHILLNATHGLFIPDDGKKIGTNSIKFDLAETWLLEQLRPYRGMPAGEIARAARGDKFRYLGRRFRFAVIDEIRKSSANRREAQLIPFDDAIQQARAKAPRMSESDLAGLLSDCDFLDAGQQAMFWILWRARDKAKGDRTQDIADARAVSLEQARKDLRSLREALQDAIKAGHRGARDLFEGLARYITPAAAIPRDLPFASAENPGTSIHGVGPGGDPIQFDHDGGFGRRRKFQDPDYEDPRNALRSNLFS